MLSKLLIQLYKEQSNKLLVEVTRQEILDLNNRFNDFTPKEIKYKGLQFRTKTLYWETGKYVQKIRIPDLAVISRIKGEDTEKAWMAINQGDMMISCSCPDYTFGGFKYIASQLGYNIPPDEHRYPKIRNPKVDGGLCKHLNYLLTHINDFNSDIVTDLQTIRKMGKNTKRITH